MVIPDWMAPRPPKIEFEPAPEMMHSESLARPVDRLAAAIVDVFILLIPLYILLSSPLKRGLTASFILGAESELVSVVAWMLILGIVLLTTYQALMHYYFAATVGKMIFNLRVRPMFKGDRISLPSSFLRGLLWTAEICCLGLPMLSVFSNAKRRTIHDRVCDTVVVSSVDAGAEAPAQWERGLVRGFFVACALVLMLVGVSEFRVILEKISSERGIAAVLERESGLCEVVTKNIDQTNKDDHARVEMAMSLYAAGLAERGCLEAEIEHEITEQIPSAPVTFLAQAFVNADDAEISNSYLDQVCEDGPETNECAMSKVVSRWSEEDWGGVEQALHSAKPGSGYLEVWGVRHFMKQAQYKQALTFLDSLTDRPELAEFNLVQRVRALYNANMDSEANVALAQALPVLPKEDGEDISSWICAQQLQSGCAALEKLACREVRSVDEHTIGEVDFERPSQALSRVMALECHSKNTFDYLTFSEAVQNVDWRDFFRANLKRQKDDLSAAFKLFEEVISSATAPDILRIEALRRVSEFADHRQTAALFDDWQTMESKEAWVKSGNILFARMVEKNDEKWAMRIAEQLIGADALSQQGQAILAQLMQQEGSPKLRSPASKEEK